MGAPNTIGYNSAIPTACNLIHSETLELFQRLNCRKKTWNLLISIAIIGMMACASIVTGIDCNNTCTTYPEYWKSACPPGERCITFKNNCSQPVSLYYEIGCNANGIPGAPTCDCTEGPTIAAGQSVYWQIVDANDNSSCVPKVTPACLTSGLAVIANYAGEGGSCTKGTRVEFTAGNHLDPYGKFDSYDIDVEKDWYSMPVTFAPNIMCAHDSGLDCRPLWCNSSDCPDAYRTPTTGGCSDGRSPQGSCQDTFGNFGTQSGYTVVFCPAEGKSCQKSQACSQRLSSSLGDFVWIDFNRNGIQDSSERGLPGVTVNLYDSQGVFLETNITNASGHYGFTNLKPQSYILKFIRPNGYIFSSPKQGSDPTKDSNVDPATGRTGKINLSAGQEDYTWDAGLIYISAANINNAVINKETVSVGNQTSYATSPGSAKNNINIDATSGGLIPRT
jgi:hypothetical protein